MALKFDMNDVIVRDDHEYPDDALVVSGFSEQGELLAYPKGGGVQYRIPQSDWSRFRILTPEMQIVAFRRAESSLDGLDCRFPGWANGEKWNGWAKPMFEKAAAERVLTAMASGGLKWRYDAENDAFITESEDGDEVWQGTDIRTNDGNELRTYPIGAGCWIWEVS